MRSGSRRPRRSRRFARDRTLFRRSKLCAVGWEEPVLRVATLDDGASVDALMKESGAVLFPRFYDERQAASAVRYVAQVDPMLLADGTYFVLESGSELVGCGGWSRRDKLYTGSGESLPGLPLYLACGFEPLAEVDVEMPDGVTLPCVSMEKTVQA